MQRDTAISLRRLRGVMGFPPYDQHFADAARDIEKSKTLAEHNQAQAVAMGTLDETQLSTILALALARAKTRDSRKEQEQRQTTRELLQQALIDYMDRLNREIAEIEAGFELRFGDAWREEIALRVFGADDIPQQLPGESIEDYRERLQERLVEEMLNPDGSIKAKYKNDPELRKYAEWAQKIYNRDAALAIANDLKDPATTHEQTREALRRLEDARSSEQNTYAARALEGSEYEKQAVLNTDDNLDDDRGTAARSSTAASNFTDQSPSR